MVKKYVEFFFFGGGVAQKLSGCIRGDIKMPQEERATKNFVANGAEDGEARIFFRFSKKYTPPLTYFMYIPNKYKKYQKLGI